MSFPYAVTAGEPEVFVVHGRSATAEIEWRLELDWLSAGRRGTVTIDDQGTPFHTYPNIFVLNERPPGHLHDFLLSRTRDPETAAELARQLRSGTAGT